MANYQQLTDAVKRLLSNHVTRSALRLNSATRERAFEAYVFCLILKAIRKAKGTVTLRGIRSGANPNPVIFRGSPGRMSSQAQDFAYAECELNGKKFEVHVGVQYVGTSRALHEVDVSVFDHDSASNIRISQVLPKAGNLRAALECKFYDSSLGVAVGRTFVGLLADLGTLRIKYFATNGGNAGLANYFSKSQRPDPFFALSPLHKDVEQRFVNTVEQEFRKWCGVY